ncbi:DNA-directed RNA polymerase subunit beta' [Candidatus Peregrinibacteria bacterium]|nr:DNA-directed RNA polymerase subunit beta' [Candidatus Peregrinibacteria bacterium]MBT4147781.1 DNA-directed RNA polymerase subunit beta' [Candidatus Peregrinibacteria bacterium]MBT4366326.1 DNA-directed RNA polymerase subunit beta' [Candidatus Peregrinibacteria bacterium]MBT4456533.1 DNA-directed RNA polymerase subunit beta' [Candidatus Peregrinibacteria bacterium]
MAQPSSNKKNHYDFNAIAVSVASPEQILSWSHGEVKKPETINYRTQKPERDGLFCEKIFGPTKNWECYCGKYKRIRYKGVICEKCGVEVTRSSVRRVRMGNIKLACPVTHIWYVRSTPSRVGLLLDIPVKTLEQVIYFAAYMVKEVDIDAREDAKAQLKEEFKTLKKKILTENKDKKKELEAELNARSANAKDTKKALESLEKTYAMKVEELDEQHQTAKEDLNGLKDGQVYSEIEYRDMSLKFGHVFKAGTGAEVLREIIEELDLKKLQETLTEEIKKTSGQRKSKLLKRLKLAGSLQKADIKAEWMILTVLPVIPPDLRPMVQLDGGRFAASDLNDLYRRVINRNNRLKRLMSIGAPEVICRNEKRMLQEAVDTLLNNSARSGRAVFTAGDKRKLRSLSDMLKGKQGRFRQNLLGKRVDYSGRSVIVIGPQLKLHQCGLPKSMALELFKPFVIGRLISDGYAHNIKNAEKLIQASKREVWDILEEVIQNHYVLLNRAPTLHRLGIQAFQPVLTEGKAIRVHALVCAAFNADFDGDQMAVHVPLSKASQEEARNLIKSANNLLKPSSGDPIITPTQDMVLGCYYLTKLTNNRKGEGMVFVNEQEAVFAYQSDKVHLQAPIKARVNGEIIETTVGRLIFNSIIPDRMPYYNESIGKKKLGRIVRDCFEIYRTKRTAQLGDDLKRFGFKFATKSGLSIAASDMVVPKEKVQIVEDASDLVKKINNQYWKGLITEDERYNNNIKVWSKAKSEITNVMIQGIKEDNDLFYMIDSGARGNWGQITQLCGIKGLVANPAGKTIELPIKSNLKEGFSILEYFIATHGGRKGKSDTALKTAEAGYLTRRLVDAVQNIIIKEYDCKSPHAHLITREESEMIGEKFEHRIYGRTLAEDLVDPETGEIIGKKSKEIGNKELKKIEGSTVQSVKVRSVMTCQTEDGICIKCYGKDLGRNETVNIGTAVGIIAAQSIGEPGTQLTMRTFHMGGVAEGSDITQGLTRVEELFEARPPKSPAVMAEISGKASLRQKDKKVEISIISDEPIEQEYELNSNMVPTVKKGDKVAPKMAIAKAEDSKATLKAIESGKVKQITDDKIITISEGPVEKTYKIPQGKTVTIKNGDYVEKGTPLTNGHLNLKDLMSLTDIYNVEKYIMTEVQSIYASQGQTINDKHIEIISRQMLSKVRILESGNSPFLPGEIVDIIRFEHTNEALKGKKKQPARGERLLLGLTRIALFTDSWLSAASFQETIRVLVEASTTKKIDDLVGLKENVIIGKLIPAGETYRKQNEKACKDAEKELKKDRKEELEEEELEELPII